MATLAAALRRKHVAVVTPSAPPELDDWIEEIERAGSDVADPVVLLGFSAAGPRLPAAATRISASAMVFLDARLPADGVAPVDGNAGFAELLEQMAIDQGLVAPWPRWWGDELLVELVPDHALREHFESECPPLPLVMFHTPVPAPPFDGPCGYVRLSEAYDADAAEAASRGWPLRRLRGHHLWPLVQPDVVADAVLEVVAEL